jgi:hypothetical protein
MEARKYDSEFRKKMVTKIERLDKRELIAVYKALTGFGVEHSSNSNGFFYNVNRFSDECIEALETSLIKG